MTKTGRDALKIDATHVVKAKDFNELVESSLNIKDDGLGKPEVKKPDDAKLPLRIENDASLHRLDLAENKQNGWRLSVPLQGVEIAGKKVVEPGISIAYGDLNSPTWQPSQFYIGSKTGKIGINTHVPEAQLHIAQKKDLSSDLLKVSDSNNAALVSVNNAGELNLAKAFNLNGKKITTVSTDNKLGTSDETLVTQKAIKEFAADALDKVLKYADKANKNIEHAKIHTGNIAVTGITYQGTWVEIDIPPFSNKDSYFVITNVYETNAKDEPNFWQAILTIRTWQAISNIKFKVYVGHQLRDSTKCNAIINYLVIGS